MISSILAVIHSDILLSFLLGRRNEGAPVPSDPETGEVSERVTYFLSVLSSMTFLHYSI